MTTKLSLQKLFLITCVLKVGSSTIGWYLHDPWIFGLVVPIGFMALYMYFGYNYRDSDVSAEKFADSCYYLGFIFTIVSIIFSLFDLPNIGNDLTSIAVRFGAAMVSTVLGLFVRVLLVSFRPSMDDAMSNIEDQVVDSTQKVIDEFHTSFENLQDFRSEVMNASRDAVNAVRIQIEEMAEEHKKQTETFFANLTQQNAETLGAVMKDIQLAGQLLTGSMEEYRSSQQITLNNIDLSVVKFVENLFERLHGLQLPDDLFAKHLKGPIDELSLSTDEVTLGVKTVSNNVLDAAKSVGSSVKRINEKAETLSHVLDVAQVISAEQRDLVQLIKTQQDSAFSQLDNQHAALLNALTNHQESIAEEVRDQAKGSEALHSALAQLLVGMNEIVSALDASHTAVEVSRVDNGHIKQGLSELVALMSNSIPSLTTAVNETQGQVKAVSEQTEKAHAAGQGINSALERLVQIGESHLEANQNSLSLLDKLSTLPEHLAVINARLEGLQEAMPAAMTEALDARDVSVPGEVSNIGDYVEALAPANTQTPIVNA
jgi:hypothetical protein